MNKNDFIYKAELKAFITTVNGIEVFVNEEQMTDEALILAEQIIKNYPEKVASISDYLSKDDSFVSCYGNIPKKEIMRKLCIPSLRMDKDGGILFYCNHEFDQYHIIDLEFGGALEKFYYVSIDG